MQRNEFDDVVDKCTFYLFCVHKGRGYTADGYTADGYTADGYTAGGVRGYTADGYTAGGVSMRSF